MAAEGAPQGPGLRERKKLQRRHAIETAALELFGSRGFDATTTEQIAAAADIAPRTFFGYFATKEDVVLADYQQRLERIIGELAGRPLDEAPWDALERALLVVASDYESEREQLVVRFRIMMETPSVFARNLELQAGWEEVLADALGDRMATAPTDITPRLMAAAAMAAMSASMRHWMAHGQQRPLPELVSGSFGLLRKGFASVQ